MKRICPYSKVEYLARRSNQIYVDSKARIKANNQKQRLLREKLSFINTPLRNNFLILNDLLKETNEVVYSRQWLLGRGINLKIHSHIGQIDGNKRFFIYNFGIIPLENDSIKIIKYDDSN